MPQVPFEYTAVMFFGHPFQNVLLKTRNTMSWSYNPRNAVTLLVWALPRSLATTCGIIVIFSSCRYLDVSVPCVRPYTR